MSKALKAAAMLPSDRSVPCRGARKGELLGVLEEEQRGQGGSSGVSEGRVGEARR